MSSGHELPMNPYSDIPPTDASPKPSEGRRRTVLYVLHIAVTVAIMFFAPQPAKIVTIAAWAIFNTWKKDLPALAGGWTSFSMFVITVLASWISSGTMQYSHVQDVMALQYHFRSIESSLEYHHKTHGSYPSALSDPPFEFPNGNDSYQLKDPWNRSILYTVEGDGFRLSSFGRDDWMQTGHIIHQTPSLIVVPSVTRPTFSYRCGSSCLILHQRLESCFQVSGSFWHWATPSDRSPRNLSQADVLSLLPP
jgi:hypothetical protein